MNCIWTKVPALCLEIKAFPEGPYLPALMHLTQGTRLPFQEHTVPSSNSGPFQKLFLLLETHVQIPSQLPSHFSDSDTMN